jgi:hypothetical protein
MRCCVLICLTSFFLSACLPGISKPSDANYNLEGLVFEVVPTLSINGLSFAAYVTNKSKSIKVLEYGDPCDSLTIKAYEASERESKLVWDGVIMVAEETIPLHGEQPVVEIVPMPCLLPLHILETHPKQKHLLFTQYYSYQDIPIRGGYYFTAQLEFHHWENGKFSPLQTEVLPLGEVMIIQP